MKVLYVAGRGRSGSTLVDTLLGQLDGFVSVGELRNLWTKGLQDCWPCGCGKPLRECAFWSAVLAQAFPEGMPDPEVMARLQARVARTRHMPRLWLGRHLASRRAPDPYAAALARLYRAVMEVSGAEVVVDSSKHPADATIVSTLQDVELYLLHLVRDPRAVAFSWSRVKVSETEPQESWLPQHGPIHSSLRWLVWNAAAARFQHLLGRRYLLLRYEDLATDPRAGLNRVLAHVGRPPQRQPGPDGTMVLGVTHTVCGNPSRFRLGEVPVRLDDEWQAQMGTLQRTLATIPALPLLRRYGYR